MFACLLSRSWLLLLLYQIATSKHFCKREENSFLSLWLEVILSPEIILLRSRLPSMKAFPFHNFLRFSDSHET
ncbi:predicted protein [Sclerotinia sclerotiorum 1980 UF-70]|uniref:Secreted protein n=1 Tax=Sclerotinia sclerotiorum (strain ATCC 18683 / 1980 / Ss-1) TaxID=665079 RepID=A7EP27_SCLS1|nr:predicted protein [Sclerotinia sclerotiorum 1980 UF-70]EDO04593.1 predicted protein [Sclerotinia sclerotiorum 1980 UF-70]